MDKNVYLALNKICGTEVDILSTEEIHAGRSNHTYLIKTPENKFLVRKISDAALGVDRAAEMQATKKAAEIGIAPEIIYWNEKEGILVTRFLDARMLQRSDILNEEILHSVLYSLRKIHSTCGFSYGLSPVELITKYHEAIQLKKLGSNKLLSRAIECSKKIITALNSIPFIPSPCHNDPNLSNVLYDGVKTWFIDWEYACMGNCTYDIAHLCNEFACDWSQMENILFLYAGNISKVKLSELYLFRIMHHLWRSVWYLHHSTTVSSTGNEIEIATENLEAFLYSTSQPACKRSISILRG